MPLGDYQFSVGTMEVQLETGQAGAPCKEEVGLMTEITVSYDGDPQSLYGGDYRLPVAIELGNRTGEITAMSTRFQTDDAPLTNKYVNVNLGLGDNGGGLLGLIRGTKLTSYSVTSTQNDFVMSDLTFTIGDPDHLNKGAVPPTWSCT